MSKNLMYKEYAFIFDPADSFQYMYEFEAKLDEFFSMTGYEVEKITNSDYGKCIVYIRKKDIMEEMAENDEAIYNGKIGYQTRYNLHKI